MKYIQHPDYVQYVNDLYAIIGFILLTTGWLVYTKLY